MSFTIFSPRLTGGLTGCFELQCASQKFCVARFCKNNAVQGLEASILKEAYFARFAVNQH
jgi:hypothetical protein